MDAYYKGQLVYEITEENKQSVLNELARCGYFGNNPEVGDYTMYLGPSDGGFLVISKDNKDLTFK